MPNSLDIQLQNQSNSSEEIYAYVTGLSLQQNAGSRVLIKSDGRSLYGPEEPAGANLAHPDKADVDRSYVELMHRIFDEGTDPAIAGHDPRMIQEAIRYSQEKGIAPDRFEFQMLFGIRRDLQRQVVDQGFRLRVYVPYGTAWYPYFMRRLSERPANVLFVARSLFR